MVQTIDKTELAVLLTHNNLRLKKSYQTANRTISSFSMKHSTFDRLGILARKYGVTKSAFMAMLIDTFEVKE